MKRDILISTPARRYAKATLEASIKMRNFSSVLEELESFAGMMESNELLRQLFLNPAIPYEKKKGVVEEIGKKVRFQQLTMNVLNTLIHRQRLNLLDQVVTSAEQQFLERQGIMVVQVLSARKLTLLEEQNLINRIEQFTGKKVQLENRVDPSLIGGMVTRIGSTLYDGSVLAKLHQMKVAIAGT